MSETALERQGAATLDAALKKYWSCFKNVLPKHLTPDRWAWLCINSIRQNPKLCEVKTASFINSVMLASNMGLEIRNRSAYLIPFGQECQLLIDYRGKMELARRAGVGAITLELVREGDEFDTWHDEHGPHMMHRWIGRERGEIRYGYMSAQVNGSRQIEIMTLTEIEGIRKRARSGAKDLTLAQIRQIDGPSLGFRDPHRVPWVTDYDQMARKTVMHRGSNYLPQSAALLTSQDVDAATLGDKSMPIAPELTEFLNELDPADNKPLVEIPATAEERSAAQARVVEQKTGIVEPPRRMTKLADWAELSGQPSWVEVAGIVYRYDEEAGTYKPWIPELKGAK